MVVCELIGQNAWQDNLRVESRVAARRRSIRGQIRRHRRRHVLPVHQRVLRHQLRDLAILFGSRFLIRNHKLFEPNQPLDQRRIFRMRQHRLHLRIGIPQQLQQHRALLRPQSRILLVRFRIAEQIPFQIRQANPFRFKCRAGPQQSHFHVLRPVPPETIHRQQHDVRMKEFHAPPHQANAPHGLVPRHRVARRRIVPRHRPAKKRRECASQKLRHRPHQIRRMFRQIRRHFRRLRLEKSRR